VVDEDEQSRYTLNAVNDGRAYYTTLSCSTKIRTKNLGIFLVYRLFAVNLLNFDLRRIEMTLMCDCTRELYCTMKLIR
jgi:hypothetical protein